MTSKPPVKLLPDRVHLFEVERGGLRAVEWNVPLHAARHGERRSHR
jgi:hypothetical protein